MSDGAIATKSVAEGRLIPVLLVDCSGNHKVVESVELHRYFASGDIKVFWATAAGKPFKGYMLLCIDFVKPNESQLRIAFDPMSKDLSLVDAIIQAGAVYLVPSRPGERFRDSLESPRILAEVPPSDFSDAWDETFLSWTARKIRQGGGVPRRRARRLAKQMIESWRELSRFTMPSA